MEKPGAGYDRVQKSKGFRERYSEEHPERILEFSDSMGIKIRPHKVTLDRLENLLAECVVSDQEKELSRSQ